MARRKKIRFNFKNGRWSNKNMFVTMAIVAAIGIITTAFILAATTTRRENITLYYQHIGANFDTRKFGDAAIVVASDQGSASDEAATAATIKSSGAKAYHYIQGFWMPWGRTYQGIDISQHPDWIFCDANGRVSGKNNENTGTQWWIFDLNEKAARNAITNYMRQIKSWGYDGVFIDMGNAAMKPGARPDIGLDVTKVSTCTQYPVVAGRSFKDSYIGMGTQAKGLGLESILNYGRAYSSPELPAEWWNYIKATLDEGSNQTTDWNTAYLFNTIAQNKGKVYNLIKVSTDDDALRKDQVYYSWARSKLFAIPVGINTGDDKCGGYDPGGNQTCLRNGVYPELVSSYLGDAFAENGYYQPASTNCDSIGAPACLWYRHYGWGLVVVNNTTRIITQTFSLNLTDCRYVFDVYANLPLNSNTCKKSISVTLPPNSGRVYRYANASWK